MDLNTIPTLLSAIKTATDIAKFIKDTDLTFEKAESKLKLAELISALADAKIQISEIQQTILDRDSEIRRLMAEKALEASLMWEAPYYWRTQGHQKEGPYCQPCYDKDKQLVRLFSNYPGYWECKVCHQHFEDKNYRPHTPQAITRYDPFEGY